MGVRYVITKFSRMDGLPNFITHGAPLARFARRSSTKNTVHNGVPLKYHQLYSVEGRTFPKETLWSVAIAISSVVYRSTHLLGSELSKSLLNSPHDCTVVLHSCLGYRMTWGAKISLGFRFFCDVYQNLKTQHLLADL